MTSRCLASCGFAAVLSLGAVCRAAPFGSWPDRGGATPPALSDPLPSRAPIRVRAVEDGDADDPETVDADTHFAQLKARWDASNPEPFEERILLVHEFANARCAATVGFLSGLYASEKNPGIFMAVSQSLGKIGTEDAIQAVITKGLPLLAGDSFSVTAIADALENRLEPKAEQWVLRTGLKAPALRQHPAIWARVIRALSNFEDPQRVTALLGEIARPGIDAETIAAVLGGLESTPDRRLVAAATRFLKHAEPNVETAAMSLLLAQGGPKQQRVFESGLRSRHWQVRLLSLRTIARIEHRKTVEFAIRALDDADQRVQITAVRILLDAQSTTAILPLIRKIDRAEGRVQDDIVDALTRLTGEDFGPSTFQWEGWWQAKGSKLAAVTKLSGEDFSALKQKEQTESNTVAYYGLRILSDNFAFIFDASESMQEEYEPIETREAGRRGRTEVAKPGGPTPAAKKSKIAVAKEALKKVLHGLPVGKHFDIICFESVITDFLRDVLGRDTNALVTLDEAVRAQALGFVESFSPQGQTYLLRALEQAFANENVDTIYLLSDGAPTPAETAGMDVILARLRKINQVRCVKINTIGFHLQPDEKKFLQQVAEEHFGVFVER